MRFTVTMECEGCGRKFAGQAEHLVEAISAMVGSTPEDHYSPLSQELAALYRKTQEVESLGGVMVVLDEQGSMTREQFEDLFRRPKKRPVVMTIQGLLERVRSLMEKPDAKT